MDRGKTLVDTSAWIETLRNDGDPDLRARIFKLTTEGESVLCDMVLLELWNGARGVAEHRMLRDLRNELEIVPTTAEVWDLASDLAQQCRRSGFTIPATDLLIAACAKHHNLQLVHVDHHFDQIAQFM